MSTKAIRGYIRDPSTGAGIPNVSVALKRHNGGTTVVSDETDANGLYEMDRDAVGYPGPTFLTFTQGSTTDITSGNVVGQVAGLVWGSDFPDVFALLGIGVAPDVSDELEVTADGTTMAPEIAAGFSLLKDGFPYLQEDVIPITLDAADATHPRRDRIVVRLTREGQTDQGKALLAKITGTPAASPALPNLTQSSTTWDYELAEVLVGAGVTTIAADKVTDKRSFLPSATELAYLRGVTDGIQTQLDGKQPLDSDLTTIAANITAAGHAILDDANAPAQRTTLGLGNVDNTSDANKPVSTATQTALDAKQPLDSDLTTIAANITAAGHAILDDANAAAQRTTLGLGNVDNTSDANKPVSTATQTALDAKAPINDPNFTGTVTAVNLTATGNVMLGNGQNDTLTIQAHIETAGSEPSIAVGSGAAGGTGEAADIVFGNDTSGQLSVTTGSSPTSGPFAVLTFNVARPDTNFTVQFTPANSPASVAPYYHNFPANTTTTCELRFRNAPDASTEYVFNYEIKG